MVETEAALLQQALTGDTQALSALLAQHGPAVRAGLLIDRKWSGILDADDVMQVTYLEAFLRIQDFHPAGPGAFLAWLRRVADNNLRDAIKGLERLKRPPPARRLTNTPAGGEDSASMLLNLLGVTTTTPSRAAAGAELRTALDDALAALPDDYATVVRLYDLQGCPIAEIAQQMGRSPGAVHMLRSRAHVHLRALLGAPSRFFSAGA